MKPEVRAALLFALWHHQGSSSDVGQPIRALLGIGQYDRLSDADLEAAKSFSALTEAKQQGSGEVVRGVCKWYQQDEGYEVFSTSCGHEYQVNDCTDGDVQLPFCPYCARRIEGSAWTPGDEAPQGEAKQQSETMAAKPSVPDIDGQRWRALVGCARIRVLGSAGLVSANPDGYAHLGLELWTHHEAGHEGPAVEWLTAFADRCIAAQPAEGGG